ncbi:MAG TPA: bacillithiol biosynthesis BshC [Gemmatirosa sp.]|nr:bacillithiol biosynthesis BshC [Gemmatirosa sp.]
MSPADGASPLAVRTNPPGGGPLVQAAIAGETPPDWYVPVPRGADAWRLHLDEVRGQFSAGAWLELLGPAFAATGAAAERLARSGAGAGVVVTTGQQPGLFGGPLYVLSKAISALALADALEAATGVPVAPVFWAATDDADFAEASRTSVAHGPHVHPLAAASTAVDGVPMSAVRLGADVPALYERLARAAGSAAHLAALDAARNAYVPGRTVGDAYVALLREVLAPLGIAVLDASHPATREGGFNLLRRALLVSEALERETASRSGAITGAGFTPQVPDVPGRSLVFTSDAAGRKMRVPTAEARALVPRVARGALGPNVLLRPVMERQVLPTVAYLAGPGEYAYFAQVSAVAQALAVPQPLAVPRWSGTVVEPQVARALERLDLAPEALRDAAALEARLARAAIPADVRDALVALRAAVASHGGALAAADRAALVPERAVLGARAAIEHRIDRLERRYAAAVKRGDDARLRDLAVARAALWPGGAPQERTLAFLPLLARHGDALLDAMRVAARGHADALVRDGLAGVRAEPLRA